MSNLFASMFLIVGAVIAGFLLGRLWEILLAPKGGTLTDAIMTAKAIRRKL